MKSLTPKQIEAFSGSGLPERGFALERFPLRYYPQGTSAAHLLGYLRRTQTPGLGRYQANEVAYADYAGAAGLEEALDADLRGAVGGMTIGTTPDGLVRSSLVNAPAIAGKRIRTTLQWRVQKEVESALDTISSKEGGGAGGPEAGAAVVINVHSGDIVAMASRPSYDPNDFLPAIRAETWNGLSENPALPLFNRGAQEQRPPGSVFKIVTSLAAMRAGVLDPHKIVETTGFFRVGNVEYRIPDEVGSFDFREAFAHSINLYFFGLGLKVGRDNLVSTAQDLGVGKPTGFLLPEAAGRMPDNAFVLATHRRNMGPGDVTNTAIGQGDVLLTPLQMARLSALVANEGTLYAPRLVSAIEDAEGNVLEDFPPKLSIVFPMPDQDWWTLRDAMQAVTDIGTGHDIQPAGLRISGKTGTAQVGTKAVPREVVWFTGYVPSDNPEYAFAVMVEGNPGESIWGGEVAGSLVKRIFSRLYPAATER